MLSFNNDLAHPHLRAFAHTVPAGLLFSQISIYEAHSVTSFKPMLKGHLQRQTFPETLSKRALQPPALTPYDILFTYPALFMSFTTCHLTVKKHIPIHALIRTYSTHTNLFIVYPLARVNMP